MGTGISATESTGVRPDARRVHGCEIYPHVVSGSEGQTGNGLQAVGCNELKRC